MNHRIHIISVDRETGEEVLHSRRLLAPENVDRHLDVVAEYLDLNSADLEGQDVAIVIENSTERIWPGPKGWN